MSNVAIYLAGGQRLEAQVEDGDLEEAHVETVDELIEKTLSGPPRWDWIGDARVFTQAVSAAIEL